MPGVGLEVRRTQAGQAVGSSGTQGQGNSVASPEASSQGGTEGELRLPASSAFPAANPGLPGNFQTAATMQFNVGKVTLALMACHASCVIGGLAIVPACFQSESLVLFCDDDSAEMEALAAACALITSH